MGWIFGTPRPRIDRWIGRWVGHMWASPCQFATQMPMTLKVALPPDSWGQLTSQNTQGFTQLLRLPGSMCSAQVRGETQLPA